MKKRVMSLLAVFMVCFCCGVLVQGNIAKADTIEEAENYELGETYNGAGAYYGRYFKFDVNEKSHVTLYLKVESNSQNARIYDDSGNVVLADADIEYEKNELTGWYSASQSRTLDSGSYYLNLKDSDYSFSFEIQAEKQIKLPKGKISSLKSSKSGQMAISCETSEDALGYRIQYSTDYKFKKGVKTIRTAENAGVIKGLKKGARYYVKVCPYSVYDDGVTVYGQNSLVKSVKIRK